MHLLYNIQWARDLLNGIRLIKKTIHTTWFSKPNFSMQATQTEMSAQNTAFADMDIKGDEIFQWQWPTTSKAVLVYQIDKSIKIQNF